MRNPNIIPVTDQRFVLVDTDEFADGGALSVFTGVCGALDDFAPRERDLLVSEHGRDEDAAYWCVADSEGLVIVHTGRAPNAFEAVDDMLGYLADVERVRRDFLEAIAAHL